MTTPVGPLRLTLIIASTRTRRLGPTVAAWFAEQVTVDGTFTPDVVDLASYDVPNRLGTRGRLDELGGLLGAADGIAIVTPEYNHNFPGTLKNAIDHFQREWAAKPVGFVSYGGLSGGLRAVEALRPVFAELHAVTLRDTVSFHDAHNCCDTAGTLVGGAGSEAAASQLIAQLRWWAVALRQARAGSPYPA